ncbi:MAG TPA: VWA domain-containing protein [Blastocatellia bacterium]|nr:VWA domain-containing protein [Blastocatellia bacterium]
MKNSAPKRRRGFRRVGSILLLALAFVTAAATLRAQGSAVRAETFSLKLNGEVVVENSRGSTRIESWDYQTVRVIAEKKASTAGSIEPGELVLMGAQNSIIVQCRQGAGRIDLTIYVPQSARLQVTGGSFPVEVNGSLAGAVIETTSGSIAYRLPANDDARVAMRSAQGAVRSTVPLTAVERIGTQSIQGQLGSGAAQVILNSQTGNVTLTPGPNLSAVAKVSTNEARASAAGSQPSPSAADSETGSRTTTQQAGGAPPRIQRDPAQQSDPDIDPGATRQAVQSNGSTVFAGSDRSDDSSMTYTSGPFTRPRTERNTGGGNSGLKVRIIPSNPTPRRSPDPGGSVFDQTTDEEEARSANQSSPNRSGSGNSPTYQTNGSVIFGGSDQSDDGSSKSRVGPLERDQQRRDTSGGNSGLRVRIIPSTTAPSPARESNAVFDQPEETAPRPSPGGSSARGAYPNNQGGRSGDYEKQGTRSRPPGADDEVATATSRGGAPPVLQRERTEDSGAPVVEPERKESDADEDAIVLKAALVNLNVSVTNRSGVALANLKKEDFEVAENSVPQKIEFFQPTTAPFNLVLALDLSGSIKDKLDVVKSAALRFVDVLGPQDKVAVVTFTDEIRVVSQLTSDREELKRRIKAVDRSQGGTAFYEALWFSLMDTLRGTRGQRNAIVVMTDGVDSSLDRYNPMQSRVSFNQLARRLEESDVIIFPIYLDTEYEEVFERGNSSSEAYAIARDQLERIGELTGGQIFRAEKVGDLSGVYKQVAAAIRTVYSVGYYPTNPERDGTFRRVRVGVNRADAAVRTRKGYYAK